MDELEAELMDEDATCNLTAYLPPVSSVRPVEEVMKTTQLDVLTLLRKSDEKGYLEKSRNKSREDLVQSVITAKQAFQNHQRKGNDSPFMLLFANMSSVETQYSARITDEKFVTAFEGRIEAHFQTILKTTKVNLMKPVQHSLGLIVQDFSSIFHQLYESPSNDLQHAIIDYHDFSGILLQVIKFKYPFLVTQEQVVHKCIEECLFTVLQPTLHQLFLITCQEKDQQIQQVLVTVKNISMDSMGVPPLYQLNIYQNAIQAMRDFVQSRTPTNRLRFLALVCHHIDKSIKVHYRQDKSIDQEKLHITTDDIVPIMAFIIVQVEELFGHLASYMMIMDEFIQPSMEAGEEGYALAIMHTAVQHLLQLEIRIISTANMCTDQ